MNLWFSWVYAFPIQAKHKMGKKEGMTRCDWMEEVVEIDDIDEEEIDEERKDILMV